MLHDDTKRFQLLEVDLTTDEKAQIERVKLAAEEERRRQAAKRDRANRERKAEMFRQVKERNDWLVGKCYFS